MIEQLLSSLSVLRRFIGVTSVVELATLAEKHGYKLLGVKRFRVKDRTTFLHVQSGIKLSILWRRHIEELDIKFSEEKRFYGEEKHE